MGFSYSSAHFPHSPTVRIPGFHPGDPGSTPGVGAGGHSALQLCRLVALFGGRGVALLRPLFSRSLVYPIGEGVAFKKRWRKPVHVRFLLLATLL